MNDIYVFEIVNSLLGFPQVAHGSTEQLIQNIIIYIVSGFILMLMIKFMYLFIFKFVLGVRK